MKRSKKTDKTKTRYRTAALLKMRLEGTIYPGRKAKTKEWADDLDVDRVPDAKGRVRALITVEDCVRLLDRGLEVRLYRAHPDEPLDPKRSKKTDKTKTRYRTAALLKMRLEGTIYPGRKAKTKEWADDLDVDRGCIHDAKGRVRALITVEDCVRLLGRGLEVRLYQAHPHEPLDRALIVTDKSFRQWLDKQVSTLKTNPGPKPFVEP
jgi:hypothetical protein